jgi:hypothetical protein
MNPEIREIVLILIRVLRFAVSLFEKYLAKGKERGKIVTE